MKYAVDTNWNASDATGSIMGFCVRRDDGMAFAWFYTREEAQYIADMINA